MPIDLGSIHGKGDPAITGALRRIVDLVNHLEASLAALRSARPQPSPDPHARAATRLLEQQIQRLSGQVTALQGAAPFTPGEPNVVPIDALPLYDGSGIVEGIFALHPELVATSCQSAPGGTWDLMDLIVAGLREADTRFAFNGSRGDPDDPSEDAVAYDYGVVPGGEGTTSVYIIDVISGHCGPNPQAAWQDVTIFAPGVWISRGQF